MRDLWQLGGTVRGQMLRGLPQGRKGARGQTGRKLCSRTVSMMWPATSRPPIAAISPAPADRPAERGRKALQHD